MTQQSLTISARNSGWIDQAFLWTASSLTVAAIAATLTLSSRWPTDRPHAPPPAFPRAAWAAAPARTAAAAAPAVAFAEPVPGYPVISPFGLRRLPWEEAGRLHKGVDIAAPMGAQVLATADGVVIRTGTDAGYGRFVELAHAGGMHSLYGHLSRFEARPGAVVKRGQAVGLIGSTGSSTGAHVHFEIHDPAGRPLNPEMLLGHSFRRLADLPLTAAARLPGRAVRVAFVSFIPAAKAAIIAARAEARATAQAATLPASAPRLAVVPGARILLADPAPTFAATVVQPSVRILASGGDGRVHAVISSGG